MKALLRMMVAAWRRRDTGRGREKGAIRHTLLRSTQAVFISSALLPPRYSSPPGAKCMWPHCLIRRGLERVRRLHPIQSSEDENSLSRIGPDDRPNSRNANERKAASPQAGGTAPASASRQVRGPEWTSTEWRASNVAHETAHLLHKAAIAFCRPQARRSSCFAVEAERTEGRRQGPCRRACQTAEPGNAAG